MAVEPSANHHVDRATTGGRAWQKTIHLHLHSREKDGHVHSILQRHSPEVEPVDWPKPPLRLTCRIPHTLRFNANLLCEALQDVGIESVQEREAGS